MSSPAAPRKPLLRVPPFPGARPASLAGAVRADSGSLITDALLARIAAVRIGGDYWGRQPHLPDTPFVVAAIKDSEALKRLVERHGAGRAILRLVGPGKRPAAVAATTLVTGPCDPWHLVGAAAELWADRDDELVAIAALAGVTVRAPDGAAVAPAQGLALARTLLDCAYTCPFTGTAVALAEAIDLCAHWRRLIDSNRPIVAAIGFAAWKQGTAAPLLWSGSGAVPFAREARRIAPGEVVALWKSRADARVLARLARDGVDTIEVEDGFIRSIGLGADCVPPLSLVVDGRGIYFDPAGPSDLEQLIEEGDFTPDLLTRARRLVALIVEAGVSKYGAGGAAGAAGHRHKGTARHLLVVGQVEDDRSVQCGGGEVTTNVELLRRVRAAAPGAFISYKPHPDVEAGHRAGAVPDALAAEFADEVVRDRPIAALIALVDEVHVNTSLAGFEALLRGKPVTTHGVPFYAGWGLTHDLGAVPARRTARRTVDELAAAALLLYPRYLDPLSGLPCPPEILVRRLAEGGAGAATGPLVALRRLLGFVKRRIGRPSERAR